MVFLGARWKILFFSKQSCCGSVRNTSNTEFRPLIAFWHVLWSRTLRHLRWVIAFVSEYASFPAIGSTIDWLPFWLCDHATVFLAQCVFTIRRFGDPFWRNVIRSSLLRIISLKSVAIKTEGTDRLPQYRSTLLKFWTISRSSLLEESSFCTQDLGILERPPCFLESSSIGWVSLQILH